MSDILSIKDWDSTFENADTRKRQRLGWFLCPTGNDSSGYLELMSRGEDGVLAYAVFLAICQWRATCGKGLRSDLKRSNGQPVSTKLIASTIRMPLDIVEKSLPLLCHPDVGWMTNKNVGKTEIDTRQETVDADQPASDVPRDAGSVPKNSGFVKGEGEGEGEVKHQSSIDADGFDSFWKTVHRKVGKAVARKAFQRCVTSVSAERNITRLEASAWITERMSKFAKSAQAQDKICGKLHPTTWLNEGRYDDDDATWNEQKDDKPSVYKTLGQKAEGIA